MGELEGVQNALADGADINVQDEEGDSALHFAAFCHHKDIVIFLLENGAEVNIRNDKQETPLDLALDHVFDKEIIFILEERGGIYG